MALGRVLALVLVSALLLLLLLVLVFGLRGHSGCVGGLVGDGEDVAVMGGDGVVSALGAVLVLVLARIES